MNSNNLLRVRGAPGYEWSNLLCWKGSKLCREKWYPVCILPFRCPLIVHSHRALRETNITVASTNFRLIGQNRPPCRSHETIIFSDFDADNIVRSERSRQWVYFEGVNDGSVGITLYIAENCLVLTIKHRICYYYMAVKFHWNLSRKVMTIPSNP